MHIRINRMNRIFDLRSAHECINLGFRHPDVLQAMRDQMESVVYVTDDFATRPTAQLARTLAAITPGDTDIIVMGKALGVYCPLTAAVFSRKIAGES